MQEATGRSAVTKTLDSNYKAADLDDIVNKNAKHQVDNEQKVKLLVLLKDFEDILDSTLGKWKTEPVNIKLKSDAKPVSSR